MQLLVEAVQDYAIFLLDGEGYVTTWNIGAQRIKGYKANEIIGKHFSAFYPPEDLAAGKPRRELEIAAREGRVEDEGWRVRKDGSRFWANVVITALRNQQGEIYAFGKVTRDATERMEALSALQNSKRELEKEIVERLSAERKLHESEQSLRKLSQHLLRTQDEERRRIGRELHDSVGQYLAALKMNLDSLQELLVARVPEASSRIGQCIHLLDESISEVRTIAYLLYPPMLEETGLRHAIQWYLEGFTVRSGIRTTFDISPDFGRLPRDAELAVFRVLQESLTNVHRHSESPTAHVRLAVQDGLVIFSVEDYGKGIPLEVLEQSGRDSLGSLGVGLRGMSERVQQLGGLLDLRSTPSGTTVTASIPFKPKT